MSAQSCLKEVVGCDKDVIDKLKNLGFIFADKLIATGDFEDYKIAKDYKSGKFDFLKA